MIFHLAQFACVFVCLRFVFSVHKMAITKSFTKFVTRNQRRWVESFHSKSLWSFVFKHNQTAYVPKHEWPKMVWITTVASIEWNANKHLQLIKKKNINNWTSLEFVRRLEIISFLSFHFRHTRWPSLAFHLMLLHRMNAIYVCTMDFNKRTYFFFSFRWLNSSRKWRLDRIAQRKETSEKWKTFFRQHFFSFLVSVFIRLITWLFHVFLVYVTLFSSSAFVSFSSDFVFCFSFTRLLSALVHCTSSINHTLICDFCLGAMRVSCHHFLHTNFSL